jgi:hypothetical protein
VWPLPYPHSDVAGADVSPRRVGVADACDGLAGFRTGFFAVVATGGAASDAGDGGVPGGCATSSGTHVDGPTRVGPSSAREQVASARRSAVKVRWVMFDQGDAGRSVAQKKYQERLAHR